MLQSRFALVALFVVLISQSAPTLAAPPVGQRVPNLAAANRDCSLWINANRFMGFVSNWGGLFRDINGTFGYDYGTFYPYTSIEDIQYGTNTTSPIYAAGIWMGGYVGGDLRVTVAEYSNEYTPGPMQNGGHQNDNASFRVYKLYSDSLASNPNQDYVNWPVTQGAPLDGAGHPLSMGKQTLWTVFNDADTEVHYNNAGYTLPLGVEVHQTVYANDGPYFENNGAYIQYKLYNRGSNQINGFYIAFWMDPDLGGAGDDLVGCDTSSGIFYCYNGDNTDLQYQSTPPAVGVKVLGGPVVPSAGDTAIFNGRKMPNYRNLPMSAFSKYINGTDPHSYVESYNYMLGRQADGSDYIYNGNPLPFMCSGDPITGLGDIDFGPSDRRMMASFGPLTFNPGDSQQVLLKVAVGQGADRKSSINVMKYNLASAPASQCNNASVNTQDYGKIVGCEFFPAKSQWLKGINWGGSTCDGGLGYGADFLGSALDATTMPDSFVNVEIRFSNNVRQNAYQYIRPGFAYGGYYPVPFTVWDTDHNRQLNAAFVEWTDSRIFNQTWDLDDAAHYGGREYLVIFNSAYSGSNPYASPMNYPSRNLKNDAGSLDILYAGWFALDSSRTMQNLTTGQTLSIHVQKKMMDGAGNLVMFRDTRKGDTAFQRIAIGCANGYLPGATLIFEDSTAFSVSQVPDEWYAKPQPGITQAREMSNAGGLVEPPNGRDVFDYPNSTGDWSVNASSTLTDSSGAPSQDDWEIRFTAQGSWAYDYDGFYFGHVPFELWNIGEDTPDDPSDDHQVPTVIFDWNYDGVWNLGDRCYFTLGEYNGTPSGSIEPTWYTFGRVRISTFDHSGRVAVPETGTIVRLLAERRNPISPLEPLATDPELPIRSAAGYRAQLPETYDLGYKLQFTPKQYGDFIDMLQVRDSANGTLLATIPLIGRTLPPCCEGTTGNVNGVDIVDVSDLSALVSYLTNGGYVFPCPEEADVNRAGIIDISDLSALVSYLTNGGYVLPNCP